MGRRPLCQRCVYLSPNDHAILPTHLCLRLKADVRSVRIDVRFGSKADISDPRHKLSKGRHQDFDLLPRSSIRGQRLHTGPDGPPVTVRAFSLRQDARHRSTIILTLRGLNGRLRSLRWPASARAALILRKLMRLPVFGLNFFKNARSESAAHPDSQTEPALTPTLREPATDQSDAACKGACKNCEKPFAIKKKGPAVCAVGACKKQGRARSPFCFSTSKSGSTVAPLEQFLVDERLHVAVVIHLAPGGLLILRLEAEAEERAT